MARQQSGGRFRRFVVLLGVGALVFAAIAAFRAGPPPEISATPDLPGIGKRTKLAVRAEEPKRGLSEVRVEVQQGDAVTVVDTRAWTPRPSWAFWGARTAREQFEVPIGSETVKGLREGPATVRVIAARAGAWLRSPQPVVLELPLEVQLRPPALQVTSTATHVVQGGCEAVTYRVGRSSVRDGVQAGERWFPGFPLPGGDPSLRFALFAAPYDLADPGKIELVAQDQVGNRAVAKFIDTFKTEPFDRERIEVSHSFMSRVVPEIMAQMPELEDAGDLLENYLQINGELRRRNADTLAALSQRSVREFLWRRPFVAMPNAQVMSAFADRRTYIYDGAAVDEQDHLGFDLASTRLAAVPAANDGIVVLARYFGIYGNSVVLDHGYGLLSLYGHLSSIGVEEGQRVERLQTLGRSGETGLAAGDHLHFTILLHGLPVNPREWWDGHWIQDRLALKLGSALPFEP